ncbi:hypothetical protein CDAR_282261 [Caerostris darwini]|uniref:Uncharacterized protein n=1 Tax=Caerostris darwini TaxID=1538125 RepID=A0AAV4VEV0_9ARAC|nr:hypothetical protein CDAR_282261 [Caerostris darwini]
MEIAGAANPGGVMCSSRRYQIGETPGDRQAVHITLAVLFLTERLSVWQVLFSSWRLSQLEIDGNEMRAMYKHRSWNFLGNIREKNDETRKSLHKNVNLLLFFFT